MEKMVLRIFQREVERQCKFALMAAKDLNSALQAGDMDRIWYSVQAFLVAAGNVSKLCWPSLPRVLKLKWHVLKKRRLEWRKSLKERGTELRKSLSVHRRSPLTPRKFRNHFEHFDERLQKWATSSERRNFADSNVGPPNMIVGPDPGDYLRNFNATNFAVTFRGEVFELEPVIDAIQELWQKAKIEADKPHWE